MVTKQQHETETRCDQCSARAIMEVTLLSGFTLQFCIHHYDQNAERIGLHESKRLDQ